MIPAAAAPIGATQAAGAKQAAGNDTGADRVRTLTLNQFHSRTVCTVLARLRRSCRSAIQARPGVVGLKQTAPHWPTHEARRRQTRTALRDFVFRLYTDT